MQTARSGLTALVARVMTLASRFPGVVSALFAGATERVVRAPFFLVCGLNVLETRDAAVRVAEVVADASDAHGVPAVFKASFDKANRTSASSLRGPGLEAGLRILADVHDATGLPVLTDVHECVQVAAVADVAHALQIPAMLCRQTDLVEAAARTGRVVNIKKGQFASNAVACAAVDKAAAVAPEPDRIMMCERGMSFGHDALVVDFASLRALRSQLPPTCPLVLDATHAAQAPPSGRMTASSGSLRGVRALARAGAALRVDGIFLETHEDPTTAPVDAAVQMPLHDLRRFVGELCSIAHASCALDEYIEEADADAEHR